MFSSVVNICCVPVQHVSVICYGSCAWLYDTFYFFILEKPLWVISHLEWEYLYVWYHFSHYPILPIPKEFHTQCKYENNTPPCGRWHAMFTQALHKARGLNTISVVVYSLHSQREDNSSITGFFLPGQSMSMCQPSSCASLSSQAERMINYTKLLRAD